MKKIFSYAMLLVAGALAMTSCDKDLDSNPTLVQPTSFVLNNPEVGSAVVDLAKSQGVNLTWSQPEYTTGNAPVVPTYTVQVSNTGKFDVAYDDNAEDNSNATYIAFDETVSECATTINAAELDKALMKLNHWEQGSVPETVEVSVRIVSAVKDASMVEYGKIISNVVKFNAKPYYIELSDAPVVMWYLVGNMFGGKWGSVVGETALPMFIIPGYEYDKKTGEGEITYTNYFITGAYDGVECGEAGFKIQRDDFNWDWGLTGDNAQYDKIINRNGGGDGGHIVAGENGYYKITVDTKTKSGKMEKLDITPAAYSGICLAGSHNEWSDNDAMSPYNKEGVENHVWYYAVDFSEPQEVKFKIAGSWDTNWGSKDFPYGNGVNGGDNINVPAGKWLIIFNDITGEYNFIQQ